MSHRLIALLLLSLTPLVALATTPPKDKKAKTEKPAKAEVQVIALDVPQTLKVNGESIEFTARLYKPEIPVVRDEARLNQESPVNASLLFYRRLADGDAQGAAQLSNASDLVGPMYLDLKTVRGDDEFKKMWGEYFLGKNKYIGHFEIGAYRLLLVALDTTIVVDDKGTKKPLKDTAAQFFQLVDGKYLIDDQQSEERRRLSLIFNAYKDGKFKLK